MKILCISLLFSSFLVPMQDKERIEIDLEKGKITITELQKAEKTESDKQTCTRKKLIALLSTSTVIVAGGITLAVTLTQKN